MTLDEFNTSLKQPEPPANLHPVLQALWYDANENWEQAHEIAQSQEGVQAYDHLHAYLHRKEGDRFNASYWYRRAGASFFNGSLADEWKALAQQYA